MELGAFRSKTVASGFQQLRAKPEILLLLGETVELAVDHGLALGEPVFVAVEGGALAREGLLGLGASAGDLFLGGDLGDEQGGLGVPPQLFLEVALARGGLGTEGPFPRQGEGIGQAAYDPRANGGDDERFGQHRYQSGAGPTRTCPVGIHTWWSFTSCGSTGTRATTCPSKPTPQETASGLKASIRS